MTQIRQTNLYGASRQWASRPSDECFQNLQGLHDFCSDYRERSYTASVPITQLEATPVGDDIRLIPTGLPPFFAKSANLPKSGLTFTNFSFKQFCSQIDASDAAGYLSRLPAKLACENINHGLEHKDGSISKILLQKEGPKSTFLKAVTSRIYNRIWNSDVTAFLLRVNETFDNRLSPPGSYTNDGSGEATGTGLYASDHDMFAFLVDSEKQIDVGRAGELIRGFYIYNNEVGSGSLGICAFLCDMICGNHIIWNVKDAITISTRHVGKAATTTFEEHFPTVVAIQMLSDTKAEVTRIKSAQIKTLGKSKKAVVNYLFEKRFATRSLAEVSWDYADERDGLNPMTIWGIVQGMTASARNIVHADRRVMVEKAAAKLLEAA